MSALSVRRGTRAVIARSEEFAAAGKPDAASAQLLALRDQLAETEFDALKAALEALANA